MEANENLKKLEGARDILNKELQEASKALDVAKDGTPLEFVIKIDKNPNYKASKLQELIEFVKLIIERYSEEDLLVKKVAKYWQITATASKAIPILPGPCRNRSRRI
jgi:hypothetical protein